METAIAVKAYPARKMLKDVIVRFPDNRLHNVPEIPRDCFTYEELNLLFHGEVVYPEKEEFGFFFIGLEKGKNSALRFNANCSCWLQLGASAKKYVKALSVIERPALPCLSN